MAHKFRIVFYCEDRWDSRNDTTGEVTITACSRDQAVSAFRQEHGNNYVVQCVAVVGEEQS